MREHIGDFYCLPFILKSWPQSKVYMCYVEVGIFLPTQAMDFLGYAAIKYQRGGLAVGE